MMFERNIILLSLLWDRMIDKENRFPLFLFMLKVTGAAALPFCREATGQDRHAGHNPFAS